MSFAPTDKKREIQLFLSVFHRSRLPPYRQISETIRRQVAHGQLTAGDRLPSIRKLAEQLQLNPDTVQKAYNVLVQEGILVARPGAGFSVATTIPQFCQTASAPPITTAFTGEISRRGLTAADAARNWSQSPSFSGPFASYASPMGTIAEKEFVRLAAQTARMPWQHSGYSSPYGYRPLQKAISLRLKQFKGIDCPPEQIVVTSGTTQSLSLVADALITPGDAVWVEDPGYAAYARTFEFKGATVYSVPIDNQGFDVKAAQAFGSAKGAVITATRQWPTGVAMSNDRRLALLQWAHQVGGWIFEDDTNNVPWLTTKAVPPLRADPAGSDCVLYSESFSFQFFPGLRIGFIAATADVCDAVAGVRLLTDRFQSEATQDLLARFLMSRTYEGYLRKLARQYRQRSAIFLEAAEVLSPYAEITGDVLGAFVVLKLKTECGISDRVLRDRLREKGLFVRSLSEYARRADVNGVVLGLGPYSEDQIRAGIQLLADTCRSLKL